MVNVIRVCRVPVRSTVSPVPPAAQGIKTVRLISVVSFSWTAALAGTNMLASNVQMHHTALGTVNFMGFSFRVSYWIGYPRADCGANLGDFPLPVNDLTCAKIGRPKNEPEWTTQNEARR